MELLAARLHRLQLALVLGGHQEAEIVGVGGTHAGRVFHRRQCVAAREVGLVAVAQQPHRIHVIDLCLHPKLHIGAARQLHFSIQMQADFLALLAQVADRGLGDEELVDVGPKGVGTVAARLGLLKGRSQWVTGLIGAQRCRDQRDGNKNGECGEQRETVAPIGWCHWEPHGCWINEPEVGVVRVAAAR